MLKLCGAIIVIVLFLLYRHKRGNAKQIKTKLPKREVKDNGKIG